MITLSHPPSQPPVAKNTRTTFRLLACICTGLLLGLLTNCATTTPGGPMTVRSPDGKIEVLCSVTGPLSYSVSVDGQRVLQESRLGLRLGGVGELGQEVELIEVARETVNHPWENPWGKRRQVRDHHNELRLTLREKSNGLKFGVVFRAFDDGIGFRYVLPAQAGLNSLVLERDETEFAFAENDHCFAGQNDNAGGFHGAQEWEFKPQRLSDIKSESVIGLPLLVQTPAAWVAVTESDLLDWSGMWLGGATNASANGVTLVAKLAPRREGEGLVKASAPHDSPWRVLMIGREPGRLIESDLVLNLATPCELADPSWIKPGMMAWDHWWSGDTQMDTATLKQYIQLAADMGWAYQLVDWFWYGDPDKPTSDLRNINPAVDMNEVRRFAAGKNVRLWVWVRWNDLERFEKCDDVFARFEQWGIAGVKLDFMDSDDQFMVNWYERIARTAAAHHLMIDYHGAFKPTGLNRTLPNQITREGILGNEYNRWSKRVTPEHKLTLPFTRFLAGPADFTPGGFLNRQPGQFQIDPKATEVQGTRVAQLALFVLYDSPVGCVCDHPDHYRNQPGADFLKIVPTVWDQTRVLDGAVGEHLVEARQSGQNWFLGAMTLTARDIPVKLDFLSAGRWKMQLWHDADDSGVNAEHLTVEEREVSPGDTLTLKLAPAGGAVARFQRF
jgi:alpha-glucosidase